MTKRNKIILEITIAAFVLGATITAIFYRIKANEKPTGWVPNPKESERFIASIPKPRLFQQGPELFQGNFKDHDTFLYRAVYEAYRKKYGKEWVVGRQKIGDCVGWGWAHAADFHLAVLWELGISADWKPASSEAIYGGSRVEAQGKTFAGWSDGSYGAAAAKWSRDWGIVFRQKYQDLGLDLTNYDPQRAKEWGAYGCGGRDDRGRLDARAKEHPIKHVALVTTFQEAARAIESGYPVVVCSNQGFSSQRDKDGFARPQGTWYHCMCFIGVRWDRPGLLCLNSWGPNWISGPKWPEDMPDGSFWVDENVVERMLNQRDSYAVSGLEGFPHNDLDHGDWVSVEPPNKRIFAWGKQNE